MSDRRQATPDGQGAGASAWCWRNRHFLIAASLLAVTSIGWGWMIGYLKWATHKEAVPWPSRVEVDEDAVSPEVEEPED